MRCVAFIVTGVGLYASCFFEACDVYEARKELCQNKNRCACMCRDLHARGSSSAFLREGSITTQTESGSQICKAFLVHRYYCEAIKRSISRNFAVLSVCFLVGRW